MINTTNIKPHLKVLGLLLVLQVLYRTLYYFFFIPMPHGFEHIIVSYVVYLFFVCANTPADIFISLPIIASLLYSLYKILLGLSYQKRTTSGRLALLLAFIFICEFMCFAGAYFVHYCTAHPYYSGIHFITIPIQV